MENRLLPIENSINNIKENIRSINDEMNSLRIRQKLDLIPKFRKRILALKRKKRTSALEMRHIKRRMLFLEQNHLLLMQIMRSQNEILKLLLEKKPKQD